MNNQLSKYSQIIKSKTKEMGFEYCGIAKAEFLDEDARALEDWLHKGYHGAMSYMERNFDLRTDPRKIEPGTKSVITLLYNYYPEKIQENHDAKISKYAYGMDYHDIIRPKLRELLQYINTEIGEIHGRGFVDSAPVLERAWAQRSGLGWIGKNANLITKEHGSFYFIATLLVDIELEYDSPFAKDYCGTCTRCVDACPTGAILDNATIDASRCISYLTIELKDELIPQEFSGKMDNWMFGCDICQDVCPWNRFAESHQKEALTPNNTIMSFSLSDWLDLEENTFKVLLKNSPLKRPKWKGIKRNLLFIKPQSE